MAHPSVLRACTVPISVRLFQDAPSLASEKEAISGRQSSRNVAACMLARAAGQSPPKACAPDRPARPFTAELAPAGVSPNQSPLSLLGPTIHCRGRTCTCKLVKERRLHIGICFCPPGCTQRSAGEGELVFESHQAWRDPSKARPQCQQAVFARFQRDSEGGGRAGGPLEPVVGGDVEQAWRTRGHIFSFCI